MSEIEAQAERGGAKRQKKKKVAEGPHCALWLPQKQRFCAFSPVAGFTFCHHHLASREEPGGGDAPDSSGAAKHKERIPCPIDPSHSIYAKDLQRHMRTCPRAKERQAEECLPCFERNVNSGGAASLAGTSSDGRVAGVGVSAAPTCPSNGGAIYKVLPGRAGRRLLDGLSAEACLALLARVSAAYRSVSAAHALQDEDEAPAREGAGLARPGGDASRLEGGAGAEEKSPGLTKGLKHGTQNDAIVAAMRQLGLLGAGPSVLLELGAGKGGLASAIVGASPAPGETAVLLFDRIKPRGALDREMAEQGASVLRIKIDLRHLQLRSVPQVWSGAVPSGGASSGGVSSGGVSSGGVSSGGASSGEVSSGGVSSSGASSGGASSGGASSGPASTGASGDVGQVQRCAVAKHLCGEASDFALRCLVGAAAGQEASPDGTRSEESSVNPVGDGGQGGGAMDAVLIATCCHHRCRWGSYVNKPWFERVLAFSPEEFEWIAILSSWATLGAASGGDSEAASEVVAGGDAGGCASVGRGPGAPCGDAAEDGAAQGEHSSEGSGEAARLGEQLRGRLSGSERVCAGRQCKRLLDAGRVLYLHEHGYTSWMQKYCEQSVSPENVLLVARRERGGPVADRW